MKHKYSDTAIPVLPIGSSSSSALLVEDSWFILENFTTPKTSRSVRINEKGNWFVMFIYEHDDGIVAVRLMSVDFLEKKKKMILHTADS
jgi:hypothetical protein